jgi:hypothetical protein
VTGKPLDGHGGTDFLKKKEIVLYQDAEKAASSVLDTRET